MVVTCSDSPMTIFLKADASWSPDGTRIAFSSFRWIVGNWEIYAMDADGNNLDKG